MEQREKGKAALRQRHLHTKGRDMADISLPLAFIPVCVASIEMFLGNAVLLNDRREIQ